MKEHARATGCQPRLAAIHEATSHGAEIESSGRASSLVTLRRSFHWTARIDSGTCPLTYSALASSPEAGVSARIAALSPDGGEGCLVQETGPEARGRPSARVG